MVWALPKILIEERWKNSLTFFQNRPVNDSFSDKYLSQLLRIPEKDIRTRRISVGVVEGWEPVPVSGVEDAAYYYSTYNGPDKVGASNRRKIMVLGGGPT